VEEVNVRVITGILMLEICDPFQPFSRGTFWREMLAEALSL